MTFQTHRILKIFIYILNMKSKPGGNNGSIQYLYISYNRLQEN